MLQGEWRAYPRGAQYCGGFAARSRRAGRALVMALRDKRWEGYALLAIAVAMGLLGHFQIAYYLLIAAGLFALYLTLEESKDDPARRVARLALALGAVLLGFGLAAIQLLPFSQYIPFSPRARAYPRCSGL